jgi:diguanylate cyclase (GGDEF)-like protein
MEEQPEKVSLSESARVLVVAGDEVARELVAVLNRSERAEVEALNSPAAAPVAWRKDIAPDLVVCEIRDQRQAADACRALSARWPTATLVSCEMGCRNGHSVTPDEAVGLGEASRSAGYQGHVLVNEAALHLPFFLRYAEQRRVSERLQEARALHWKNLLEAARRMHSSLDQQYVAGVVLEEFSRKTQADKWLLYLLSDDGQFLELVRAEGVKTRPQSLTLPVAGFGVVESTLRLKEIVVTNRGGSVEPNQPENHEPELRAGASADASLCLPLEVEGQAVGVVQAVRAPGSRDFEERDKQSLAELAPTAASALHNAAQFARAERLYMQDDLTQLYNSRYLRQFLDNELRRAKRYGNPVAVIFIDLDGFKGVNDRFGHRVGSETLKEVGWLLLNSVRDTDVVARYGGDEFTVVLPETSAEKALITAERVRRRIAEWTFRGGGENTFHLTASFGIAAFPEHPVSASADMLEKADLAMYEAKAANKNNVKLAR